MTSQAIAIIPARGGSKGLPRKNILNLAGKPLIAWTIEACLQSSFVSKTVVSSDDEEILEVSSRYGAETLLRPKELATDNALTIPVILNVIDTLKCELQNYRYIVLMQPTSPLRTVNHLDEAFSILESSEGTSLISVIKPPQSPYKSFRLVNGYLRGLICDKKPFMPRQQLPETYFANGAIYIVDMNLFRENHSLLTNKCIPYEMDSNSSIDIDDHNTFEYANNLLAGKFKNKK